MEAIIVWLTGTCALTLACVIVFVAAKLVSRFAANIAAKHRFSRAVNHSRAIKTSF